MWTNCVPQSSCSNLWLIVFSEGYLLRASATTSILPEMFHLKIAWCRLESPALQARRELSLEAEHRGWDLPDLVECLSSVLKLWASCLNCLWIPPWSLPCNETCHWSGRHIWDEPGSHIPLYLLGPIVSSTQHPPSAVPERAVPSCVPATPQKAFVWAWDT